MSQARQTILSASVLLAALIINAGCSASRKRTPPDAVLADKKQQGWHFVWADEFEGPTIDTTTWTHETFPGIESGNRELQHYTDRPRNSFIEDGKLVVKAIREDYKGHDYTSARLKTEDGFSFRYGRVEGRIKLPSTEGIWPAFWMMPEKSVYGGWPHSGEIDIVESVNTANEIYGTIHYGSPNHTHSGGSYQLPATKDGPRLFSEDFHTYAIEWDPQEIRWYVDGRLYSTQTDWMTTNAPYPAPFNQEFYLVLNVAVGGDWPGPPDQTSTFPQAMKIDWVRVYQRDNEYPEVRILSPADGAHLPANEPISFAVEATDPDGRIDHVKLVHKSQTLAHDEAAPFELEIPGLADGCYDNLAVYAVDDAGVSARADIALTVGEGCPQAPYGKTPIAIPGRIEAEHFDSGRSGEAYHDEDPANSGGKLRTETAVDIGASDGGAVYIGWTDPGEWVEYGIDVARAGRYTAKARVAAGRSAGSFTLGRTDAGSSGITFDISPTGDWHDFVESEGTGTLNLPKGPTTLRLFFSDGGLNVDYILLEREE